MELDHPAEAGRRTGLAGRKIPTSPLPPLEQRPVMSYNLLNVLPLDELVTIGLRINVRKREYYALNPTCKRNTCHFQPRPVVLSRQPTAAVAHITQATQTIARLGAAFPQQAFQLLCLTAGACKIFAPDNVVVNFSATAG